MARRSRKKQAAGAPVARATIASARPPERATKIRRALWVTLVGVAGIAIALLVLGVLNRFALGAEAISPGVVPGPEGIDGRTLAAQVVAAALAALFGAVVGPKQLMERAEIDVLGRQRAVFLAFLGGNGLIIIAALAGAILGGMIAPVAMILALVGYGPVVLYLLGIPLGGAPVTREPAPTPLQVAASNVAASDITPLSIAPAPAPPTPRAPRPPQPATQLRDPSAPRARPDAAAAWLVDFAVWSEGLTAMVQRATQTSQWQEVASQRVQARDFAENLPRAGEAPIDSALAHLQQALDAVGNAEDPARLSGAISALVALRTRVVEDPRMRAFVQANRR